MTVRREDALLWLVVLGVPLVFLADVQVSYSLMEFVCTRGQVWPLYMSSIVATGLMIAGGLAAGQRLKQRGDTKRTERNRAFLAVGGVAFSGLFILADLSLLVVKVFLVRC